MTDTFVLDEGGVEALNAVQQAYRRGELQRRPLRGGRRLPVRTVSEFGKADAVISGSTTVTPGSGTVSIWSFTSTGGTTDTGTNVTAYNMTDRDVHTGGWVQLLRHERTGNWMITNGAAQAYLYEGALTAALSSTAATISVDGLQPMDSSIGTTATSLTVQNRLSWTGDDNDICYFARNHARGTWDMIQKACT